MSYKLPTCKLCRKKPANQTGSHIFSFFLIKGTVNEQGEAKRDKEISFGISPTRFIDTYFGRSINPEKIEEVKGRELTTEEIESNKNPLTIDNLVCSDCEKRFGTVETYFKDRVYDKFHTNEFTEETDKKGITIKICGGADNRMIRLFVYLHIWRAAAASYNDWKIKAKEEEELRQILDEHLGATQEETINLIKDSEVQISHFPLIVTYAETEKGKETENVILIDRSKTPYVLIINDIVVQFFVKESHVSSSINWVYGISDMIEKRVHSNFKEANFRIGILDNSQRTTFLKNLMTYFAKELGTKAMNMFSVLFQRYFGEKPTVEIGKKVSNELIKDNQPLGYKYTFEHVKEVFARNMLWFQEILKK